MTDQNSREAREREKEIQTAVQGLASGTESVPREGGEGLDLLSGSASGEGSDSATIGTGEGVSGGPSSGTAPQGV